MIDILTENNEISSKTMKFFTFLMWLFEKMLGKLIKKILKVSKYDS